MSETNNIINNITNNVTSISKINIENALDILNKFDLENNINLSFMMNLFEPKLEELDKIAKSYNLIEKKNIDLNDKFTLDDYLGQFKDYYEISETNKSKLNKITEFELKIKKTNLFLNIIYENSFDKVLLDRLCQVLNLFVNYFYEKNPNIANAKIYLVFYKEPRRLSKNITYKDMDEVAKLCAYNCGSGRTNMHSFDNIIIFATRENDMIGLLIHELLHAFKMDGFTFDTHYLKLNNRTINRFNYFESICTIHTSIYLSLINSVLFFGKENFKSLLKLELVHSISLFCKLCRVQGFKSFKDMYEKIEYGINYSQKGAMLEYILGRALFILDYENIVNQCDFKYELNKNLINENNINLFLQLLDKSFKKNLDLLDKLLVHVNNKIKLGDDLNEKIYGNLSMEYYCVDIGGETKKEFEKYKLYGGGDKYYAKYLKYKRKYLKLKNIN